MEVALLLDVRIHQIIQVMHGPGSFRYLVGSNVRRIIWLDKAAIHLDCEGHGVFFSTEGALHISIDCNNTARSRHLNLQISIVWDCIEVGKGSLSEQCVITTAERDDVED